MSALRSAQNSPFWTFSLRLYAEDGVADACLALQDRQGVDVNLLFFLLWAAANGRRLSIAEVRALVALTEDWRGAVVVPLRLVRRALRTPPVAIDAAAAAALRQDIKKAELESERLQQAALFAHCPIDALGAAEARPEQAAAANVAAYAAVLATNFDPAPVATILAALADLPEAP
jgi:uncharacterized protein (TIGR02444 family)